MYSPSLDLSPPLLWLLGTICLTGLGLLGFLAAHRLALVSRDGHSILGLLSLVLYLGCFLWFLTLGDPTPRRAWIAVVAANLAAALLYGRIPAAEKPDHFGFIDSLLTLSSASTLPLTLIVLLAKISDTLGNSSWGQLLVNGLTHELGQLLLAEFFLSVWTGPIALTILTHLSRTILAAGPQHTSNQNPSR